MPTGGKAFSYYQRQVIRQLVLEADVQRFSQEETVAYVKAGLKENVSLRYIHNVKKYLRDSIGDKLNKIREHKTMYIQELFFKRRDELEKYQKEMWRIYHLSGNNLALQKECLKELHALTLSMTQMYEALPAISGLTFFTAGGQYNGEKTISEALGGDQKEEFKPVV